MGACGIFFQGWDWGGLKDESPPARPKAELRWGSGDQVSRIWRHFLKMIINNWDFKQHLQHKKHFISFSGGWGKCGGKPPTETAHTCGRLYGCRGIFYGPWRPCSASIFPERRHVGQRSFIVCGPTLWNSLPLTVCDLTLTLTQFCALWKTMPFYWAYETIPQRIRDSSHRKDCCTNTSVGILRAGFNWWEASGPVYLGGTKRLQQLYD